MYEVVYDNEGNPCIKRGNAYIPCAEGNRDFNDFLAWNAKQTEPLDWETPIEIDVPLPVPSTEERLSAVEDAMLAQLLGG